MQNENYSLSVIDDGASCHSLIDITLEKGSRLAMDKKIKQLEVRIAKLEYVLGIFLNIQEPSNSHLGKILYKTPKEYKAWKKGLRKEVA